jgi:release factor glutamine methyltransferase
MSVPRGDIVSSTDRDVSELVERRTLKLASRRASGEPLQYLTGIAGFRFLELEVGPGVFIPRPETELVVERAIDLLPPGGRVVDIGTGSGAIALAIATERPDANVHATERSSAALAWAERNRKRAEASLTLVHCDLFSGLPQELQGTFDVVVSNPPYVAESDVHLLGEDVRDHEPHEALFAGLEGLLVVEAIASEARRWLRPDGRLVLEIGHDQAEKVSELLERLGYEDVALSKDLADRDRIAEARWPG